MSGKFHLRQWRNRLPAKAARGVGALAVAAALAAAPGARAAQPPDSDLDPWEPVNRVIFEANLQVDRFVLEPIAQVYAALLPDIVRTAIHGVLANLELPVSGVNALLQGDMDNAARALGRFTLNSTFGVAGLFDVAGPAGLERVDEDFGQTLAVWGVESGPYLVAPFIGPTTLRDGAGGAVDIFLDPTSYALPVTGAARPSFMATNVIDKRAANLERFDKARHESVDLYATVRSAYLQRRRSMIANGRRAEANAASPYVMEDEFNDPFEFILEE